MFSDDGFLKKLKHVVIENAVNYYTHNCVRMLFLSSKRSCASRQNHTHKNPLNPTLLLRNP